MHILHHTSPFLLHFGNSELKESVLNPMGCISMPMGLFVQTPVCGLVSSIRTKKEQPWVLVSRQRSFIRNALSSNKIQDNMVVKEGTIFKSSFDESLKAMESSRGNREKKTILRGSDQRKKLTDATFRKDTPQHQKRFDTTKSKRFKRLNTKKDDKQLVKSDVVGKKKMGASVQTRNGVRSQKELNYLGSKNGLNKKVDVHTTASQRSAPFKKKDDKWLVKSDVVGKEKMGASVQTRNEVRWQKELNYVGPKNGLNKKVDVHTTASQSAAPVKKKYTIPMKEMGVDDELEMDRLIFQPKDGLDGPRVSRMEMEERIQKLAIRLNDADMDMPQWMFAKTMRSARIRFSDHSMLRIIHILGKFQNWQRVLQVIEWLQMHERYKSNKIRYVYTAALDVLGKARRPVEALNLFYIMQRHKTTYPDIVTYQSIAVTLGQAGHMKELFDVIDSMRSMPKNFKFDTHDDWDPRLEPTIVIYNAVLNGCVKGKEWEGAVWVLQKLKEMGQKPSSTTYGLAMEVMLACGKYDLVHENFKLVQRSSVPNALTYRVVVNTLWREGKPDEAIATVQDMESRGLIGSASLYYDLARCLCSVGRCEEGLMQVDKICKVASKPLVVTYTGLIQACIGNGNIHDAASIFDHMQKYCSPNTVTCNIMLKAYLGCGMFKEARELFQKMTQGGHEDSKVKSRTRPDLHTFNLMLEACIREKRWDDFESAYEKMLQHGHPFNTKRHLWMILQASGAGKVKTVETTWRHLVHIDHVPPPALVKERFKMKMESDNLIEAVSSIARHPSTHQQSFSKEAWLQLLKDNAHSFKKEALDHLVSEVRNCLSMSESPNLIYQNLLDSCMEYARLDIPVTGST